ncbi:uncharacterized protein LOC143806865 [Ranitomeya variabilis]|uniref:uncharacterized protein LOC143806865 n=1 Tax=Ranitomeya variabilis TaxID=490064 RepID=UPI0040572F88
MPKVIQETGEPLTSVLNNVPLIWFTKKVPPLAKTLVQILRHTTCVRSITWMVAFALKVQYMMITLRGAAYRLASVIANTKENSMLLENQFEVIVINVTVLVEDGTAQIFPALKFAPLKGGHILPLLMERRIVFMATVSMCCLRQGVF